MEIDPCRGFSGQVGRHICPTGSNDPSASHTGVPHTARRRARVHDAFPSLPSTQKNEEIDPCRDHIGHCKIVLSWDVTKFGLSDVCRMISIASPGLIPRIVAAAGGTSGGLVYETNHLTILVSSNSAAKPLAILSQQRKLTNVQARQDFRSTISLALVFDRIPTCERGYPQTFVLQR